MKAHCFFMVVALFIAAVMATCEYDASQPLWYNKDFQEPLTPVITQIEPDQTARPGVNIIKIHGANFASLPDTSDVYFDVTPAEIVETSNSLIKVRRPNLVTDSCTIKVVSKQALVVAKYSPYKIDPVMERYGNFLENQVLSTVTVDQVANLYVTTSSTNIYKVTPDGEKTLIGTATKAPTDARIGPDGNLYLIETDRVIQKVDFAADTVIRWTQLSSGKNVKFGDFDANGYLYTGGRRTDLLVVAFDLSSTTPVGVYATEEILAIRVFNGYVYVASKTSTQPAKIWRHSIGSGGTLGSRELVLDMSMTGDFADRSVKALTFSSNGNIYIATDSSDPILIVDPATMNVDFFYKGILPPYCKHFGWGNGNYLYMISGNADPAQEWTIYRVDMGATGAP